MRVCFQLRVRQTQLEEYRRRHEAVWPDMVEALVATGWRNYSLFLAPDGLLIGYFETDSLEASLAGMARTDVNARWQAYMADLFEGTAGTPADEAFVVLPEVFNLDDQVDRGALARRPFDSAQAGQRPTPDPLATEPRRSPS